MNGSLIVVFGLFTSLALSLRVGYYFESKFLVIASIFLGIGIALIGVVIGQMESGEQPSEGSRRAKFWVRVVGLKTPSKTTKVD